MTRTVLDVVDYWNLQDTNYYTENGRKLEQFSEFVVDNRRLADPDKQLQEILLGLASEVGEVLDVYKKQLRDNKWTEIEFKEKVKDETSDLLHYLFSLWQLEGLNIVDVIDQNIKKITERYKS